MRIFYVFLLIFVSLKAEKVPFLFFSPEQQKISEEAYVEKPYEEKEESCSEKVDSPCKEIYVSGLLLVGSYDALQNYFSDFQGLHIKDLDLPGPKKNLRMKLEKVFLGKKLSQELIVEIKKTITDFYQYYKHPFVTILVPNQEVTEGVLQMIVSESTVGNISVKNNKYVPEKKILQSINASSKKHIDMDVLLTDIAWMNRNPFRNANIIFQEGEEDNTTDIDIMVEDRFPFRFFMGGDNSGSQFTDLNRLNIGFNLGNIFYENQMLSYEFSSSFDFKKFLSHILSYSIDTMCHHSLVFFGGHAKVRPKIPNLKNVGRSSQISARYEIPIGKFYKSFQNYIAFGFDFKSTNNNVATAEETDQVKISNSADLTQVVMDYYFAIDLLKYKSYFSSKLYVSPVSWLAKQKDRYYSAIRQGAKAKYFYFIVSFDQKFILPKNWKIRTRFNGQLSFANLLPSELFTLGGQSTVRGYENRTLNREEGICANFEVFSPPIKFISYINRLAQDHLEFLTFIDFGYAKEYKKTSLYTGEKTLLGTGLGLRYYIGNNLSLKFDWGYPIFKVFNNESSKIYLQGSLNF